MTKSNFLETALLDSVYRGVAFPAVTGSVHVGLKTADPLDDNSAGVEPTIGTAGYARVAVSRAAGSWSAPSDSAGNMRISNAAAINLPASTGAWAASAPLTHFIIMDAATGGNLLHKGALQTARTVDGSGITISFAAGALTIDEG